MHDNCQVGVVVFHLGNTASAEAPFLLALAWPLTLLFLMTLLLLNSIKTSEKPPCWASGFHLRVEPLEWKSVKFGVCIQVSKLRFNYSLADVTFLEDMIYLLLNCSFPFSRPTQSYNMDFTPRPMQLILMAVFIYHQHIVFWVNPLSVLSDACLIFGFLFLSR